MRKRITYSATWLLLLLLSAPLAWVVCLQAGRAWIRHHLEERLEQEARITIRISVRELTWEKEPKELNLKGRLFDVASLSVSGDTATVTGIWDEQESAIRNGLKEQGGTDKATAQKIRLLLQLPGWAQAPGSVFPAPPLKEGPECSSFLNLHYPKPLRPVVSPPPRAPLPS